MVRPFLKADRLVYRILESRRFCERGYGLLCIYARDKSSKVLRLDYHAILVLIEKTVCDCLPLSALTGCLSDWEGMNREKGRGLIAHVSGVSGRELVLTWRCGRTEQFNARSR